VRSDQEPRPSRVATRDSGQDVVVRAPPKRERHEIDGESASAQLGRDVVAGRAVALRRRRRVADAFECRDLAPEPLGERGALTAD